VLNVSAGDVRKLFRIFSDEAWKRFLENYALGRMDAALASIKKTKLDFVRNWVPRRGDASILLGVVDEGSMIDTGLLEAVEAACVATVVAGDANQVRPVRKPGAPKTASAIMKRLEDWRQGKPVKAVWTRTPHRSGDSNGIPTAADAFATLTEDSCTRVAPAYGSAIARVRPLFEDPLSQVDRVASLSDEDMLNILAGRGFIVCWTNAARHRMNAAIRSAAGLSTGWAAQGETIVVSAVDDDNARVRGIVNNQSTWVLASDIRHGDGRFMVGDASRKVMTGRAVFEFGDSSEPTCGTKSWYRQADVRAAFGYARTVHKAQGTGVETVYIHAQSLYDYADACANDNAGRFERDEWACWAYSAVTRAIKRVVFFNNVQAPAFPEVFRERAGRALQERLTSAGYDGSNELDALADNFGGFAHLFAGL
jgi:hypothetical protein